MPNFNANLSMMFNEVGFLERFGAAAKAGFRGVEFLFPYEFPAAQIREQLDKHKLKMVLFNMPPGDWAAGDRGLACDPAKVAPFQSRPCTKTSANTHAQVRRRSRTPRAARP